MSRTERPEKGVPFIVSAPSGAGKTTLCKMAVDFFPHLRHSISFTTRPPRPGEVDGVDYHFVDNAAFDDMVERGEFLEHANVYGRKYGTSRKALEAVLDEGFSVILEIDVQGAASVRKALEGGAYIFVLPPSLEACARRLKGRGKDTPEEIERRLKVGVEEIRQAPLYDYMVVNDDLSVAFEEFKSIITAERLKSARSAAMFKALFGDRI